MEKTFRYNDFLFRFGGEEFVVILNISDFEGATIAFDKFRKAIESYEFPTVGKVTVSTGITHIDKNTMPSSLLDQADQALYHCKETGRNKITFYSEIANEHEDQDSDIDLF